MSFSPMHDPLASYSERRDFYRMVIDCEVTVMLSDGTCGKGKVRNLSSNGIAFSSDLELEEGQFVDLRVQMMDERAQPLSANGEVIRAFRDDKDAEMPFEVACSIAVDYQ